MLCVVRYPVRPGLAFDDEEGERVRGIDAVLQAQVVEGRLAGFRRGRRRRRAGRAGVLQQQRRTDDGGEDHGAAGGEPTGRQQAARGHAEESLAARRFPATFLRQT